MGKLTAREVEIATGLANGETVKDLAQRLDLSCKTVEAHKFNMYRKLGVHKVQELVRLVMTRVEGYVKPDQPTSADFFPDAVERSTDTERSIQPSAPQTWSAAATAALEAKRA